MVTRRQDGITQQRAKMIGSECKQIAYSDSRYPAPNLIRGL